MGTQNKLKIRLKEGYEKYKMTLEAAKADNADKTSTVGIVREMLKEVFGYKEGNSETLSGIADTIPGFELAVKIDNKLRFLIKIEAVNTSIEDYSVQEVVTNGSIQGVDFVLLTNGIYWKVIRIFFVPPVSYMVKYEFDFVTPERSLRSHIRLLYYVSIEVLGKSHDGEDNLSLRRMRNAVGLLGIALPILLGLFSIIPFFETSLKKTISLYYYTNLRDILIAILCAVGFFLICYKGVRNLFLSYLENDFRMTNLAGIMALGVALFPTNPECCSEKIYVLIPCCVKWFGCLHYIFAVPFFIILAIISLVIFPILQNVDKSIRISFWNENHFYSFCGIMIFICLVLIVVSKCLNILPYSVFWLEAVALAVFGIAWLVKGRILDSECFWGKKINDKINEKVYREKLFYA
jgi:hypothetical protein